MKKTVYEMFFLDDVNFYISPNTPSFVYRHCSTLKVFRLRRLSILLKISLEKLLISTFLKLLSDHFQRKNIYIVNRLNHKTRCIWRYENTDSKNELPTLVKAVKKVKAYTPNLEQLAIKFEIKLIKNNLLISFFYPEKPFSEKISSSLLRDYEKRLRCALKEYNL